MTQQAPNPNQASSGAEEDAKSPWRRWQWLTAAVGAFVLFMFTPPGDFVRDSLYGVLYPPTSYVINRSAEWLHLKPVALLNRQIFTQARFAIDTPVKAGNETPVDGCRNDDWAKANNAVPLFTEAYAQVVTSRSDVYLTGATLKFHRVESKAKAIVACIEGGDGADTVFAFTVSDSKAVKLSTGGPGATELGDGVRLKLEPGTLYPVAVTVVVDGGQVVTWDSELIFNVGGKEKKYFIGGAKTSGEPKNVPSFVAEDGKWRRG